VSAAKSSTSEAAIWESIVHPDSPMSRETATRILTLSIPENDQLRLRDLAERNRAGQLSVDELAEFDNYLRVGTMLSTLKSRARKILKP
jgi:hypothetical protein